MNIAIGLAILVFGNQVSCDINFDWKDLQDVAFGSQYFEDGSNYIKYGQRVPSLSKQFCQGRKIGFYPDIDINCLSYLICYENSTLELKCPTNSLFDEQSCSCQQSKEVACCPNNNLTNSCLPIRDVKVDIDGENSEKIRHAVCSDKGEGWFPDHSNDCYTFFKCESKDDTSPVVLPCPSGMIFSSNVCTCVSAEEETCDSSSPYEACRIPEFDGCKYLVPGYYVSYMHNCDRYFICSSASEETYFFDCPTKEKFDLDSCTCVPDNNVSCTYCASLTPCYPSTTTSTTTPTTTTTTPTTTTTTPTTTTTTPITTTTTPTTTTPTTTTTTPTTTTPTTTTTTPTTTTTTPTTTTTTPTTTTTTPTTTTTTPTTTTTTPTTTTTTPTTTTTTPTTTTTTPTTTTTTPTTTTTTPTTTTTTPTTTTTTPTTTTTTPTTTTTTPTTTTTTPTTTTTTPTTTTTTPTTTTTTPTTTTTTPTTTTTTPTTTTTTPTTTTTTPTTTTTTPTTTTTTPTTTTTTPTTTTTTPTTTTTTPTTTTTTPTTTTTTPTTTTTTPTTTTTTPTTTTTTPTTTTTTPTTTTTTPTTTTTTPTTTTTTPTTTTTTPTTTTTTPTTTTTTPTTTTTTPTTTTTTPTTTTTTPTTTTTTPTTTTTTPTTTTTTPTTTTTTPTTTTPTTTTTTPTTTTTTPTTTTTTSTTTTPYSKSCSGKHTGLYPYVYTDCQFYYGCIEGLDYACRYACPNNYRFDIHSCSCLPAELVPCLEVDEETGCSHSPPVTTTTVEPTPTPHLVFCEGKGPGYYADINRNCEWYFVCMGGSFETYQFNCPSGLRFNHYTCQCDYPFAVPCTIYDSSPCFPPTPSAPP